MTACFGRWCDATSLSPSLRPHLLLLLLTSTSFNSPPPPLPLPPPSSLLPPCHPPPPSQTSRSSWSFLSIPLFNALPLPPLPISPLPLLPSNICLSWPCPILRGNHIDSAPGCFQSKIPSATDSSLAGHFSSWSPHCLSPLLLWSPTLPSPYPSPCPLLSGSDIFGNGEGSIPR